MRVRPTKVLPDYGCALQREILIQGRLYISENHICFHANIFGWITDVSHCRRLSLDSCNATFLAAFYTYLRNHHLGEEDDRFCDTQRHPDHDASSQV